MAAVDLGDELKRARYQCYHRVTTAPFRPKGLSCFFVVRPLGFEPRTCGLRVRCSAIELEAQLCDCTCHQPKRLLEKTI